MFARLSTLLISGFLFLVPVKALAEGQVNVYSERQPVFLEKVFAEFTKETGIEVKTLFAKKGLIERIKLEGDASPADLIIVADVGRLQRLKDEGVTQAVADETLFRRIPEIYRDREGHWFGVTRRARILFAKKGSEQARSDAPSYEDLGRAEFDGTVCMRVPTHPYNIALIAAHLFHHGEMATKDWLEGLKNNLGREPQGNDRAQITAVRNGECGYALANNYYYYKMLNDPEQRPIAKDVVALLPVFEGGGTHINLSGYAMALNSPNPENALMLMRFLAGAGAQMIYAEENGELPVYGLSGGVIGIMDGLKPDSVPVSDIAERRSAASRLVEMVFG